MQMWLLYGRCDVMLTQELVNLINLEADELLDTDEDNIPYVNQAIDLLSFFLAGMADPEMMVVMDVHEGDTVPTAFVDFIPHNGYPVNINGGRFRIVSGDSVVYDVKFSITKAHIAALQDPLPFKDMYAGCLCLIASYLIKKKTYIPVEYCTQDKGFVEELMTAIKAAKGAA